MTAAVSHSSSQDLDGVLVLDKPAGMTSFEVVQAVRQRLHVRKAGHTGTLDPMATGVLPICIGEATKIAGLLTADDKAYRGTARLGLQTDTLDITGQVIARASADGVTREQVERMLAAMVGSQLQRPPAFSAVRTDGVRAYERARRGEVVELEPRPVQIRRLELTRWEAPEFEVELECSKGTYVRSVVADVGQQLGCGAVLSGLVRVRSGAFRLDQAVALEAVGSESLITLDQALGHLPGIQMSEEEEGKVRQGQPLAPGDRPVAPMMRMISHGNLVAVGENREDRVWPKRVFLNHHGAR